VRSTLAWADRPTSSNTTPLKGVAVKPTPHQPTTTHNAPDAPKPTPKQLKYLRALADKTGTSFAYPQTINDASTEITRLKALPRSGAGDAQRERHAVQRHLQTRPDDATAIRERDVTGYGSTARWAHRPNDQEARS
jgi:hypothetical protein